LIGPAPGDEAGIYPTTSKGQHDRLLILIDLFQETINVVLPIKNSQKFRDNYSTLPPFMFAFEGMYSKAREERPLPDVPLKLTRRPLYQPENRNDNLKNLFPSTFY
jgi:hypothetical protein